MAKTTIRGKHIFRLCCGAAMATLAMTYTACTSDDLAETAALTTVVKDQLNVETDAAAFEGRVTNYKESATRAVTTRAANTLSMPEQPSVPSNAVTLSSGSVWSIDASQPAWIPSGETVTAGFQTAGQEIYVEGELTVSNTWGDRATIYVLPGGKLTVSSLYYLDVYDYSGNFTYGDGTGIIVNEGGIFMTSGDINVSGTLNLRGCKVYVGGALTADAITSYGGEFYFGGDITAETLDINGGANAKADGTIRATSVGVNLNSELTVGCRCYASTTFYATNSGVVNVEGYVESPYVNIDTWAALNLAENARVNAGHFAVRNANSATANGVGNGYAVIEADSITVNSIDLITTFTGLIDLHFRAIGGDNNIKNDIRNCALAGTVLVGSEDTYIPETACTPEFGTAPAVSEPEKTIICLEDISNIIAPTHTDDISCTSVYKTGNMVYVTYHQRGDGYEGCIEALAFDSNTQQATLKAWAHSDTSRDFNHVIEYDGSLYVAGGETKGGILARVPLDADGIFSTQTADSLEVVYLMNKAQGNGNCVVREGDNFLVAATGGFETLTADLQSAQQLTTAGSAKYIHSDGKSIVTLNLTSKDSSDAPAEINVYSAGTVDFSNAQQTVGGETIQPVDGKNVCKIDGDDVYVCLGKGGLKRFTNGVESGSFIIEDDASAFANGMDYDDNYVYVAYGNAGVYVLNKSDLSLVASARYTGGKSANFVQVEDGYVIVAYGLNGLHIYQLVEM